MLFGNLATTYADQFAKLFSTEDLEKFWTSSESTGDDRLMGHPMKARKDWRHKVVPLFLHGDGVDVSRKRQLDGLAACSFTNQDVLLQPFSRRCPFARRASPSMVLQFSRLGPFARRLSLSSLFPSSRSTHPPCRHLHHMSPASQLHFPRIIASLRFGLLACTPRAR